MKLQFDFTGFSQQILLNDHPFHARIYEGEFETPDGFNVQRICLDASDCALLRWQEDISRAQKAIERGLLILWELDFDLLNGSLEDETRFLTLQLNIQHFNETVWTKFHGHSLGVALFRGEIKEEVIDYLKSLSTLFSDEAGCFLFLDASMSNLGTYMQMVNLEMHHHFHLILKGAYAEKYPWAIPALGWGHGGSSLGYCSDQIFPQLLQQHLKYGLCIHKLANEEQIQQVIKYLEGAPFRAIAENALTQEWDGIDTVIVLAHTLTDQLARKLKGFIAAGGEIIMFPNDAAWPLLQEISPISSPAFLQ